MDFESRFNIGDVVNFQPDLSKTEKNSEYSCSVLAKIVGVRFSKSKVFYDLALYDPYNKDEKFYSSCPLKDVDSYFVCETK